MRNLGFAWVGVAAFEFSGVFVLSGPAKAGGASALRAPGGTPTSEAGLRPAPKPRLAGLDGLRAIAVVAVVLYHLDASIVPGGFLGVDLFFVISGFLITRLLAIELSETGTIDLRRFYWRRARRLFPAVAALLGVVAIASTLIWRDQLATLRGGAISSLTYVTNWWLIADHQSYFVATGRPSMLQHLWSLAIEEQFYLIWSGLIIGLVLLGRRSPHPSGTAEVLRRLIRIALCLAVLSSASMAVLAVRSNLPFDGDTSRVYFGSDTHSTGLFLGAAAGAWAVLHTHHSSRGEWRLSLVVPTDLLGLAGLAVLGYEFVHLSEFNPDLYRGGFLVLDAVALCVVVSVVQRGSMLGRLLDAGPMRWVGQRSYSIYLWHWPVVVATRPGLDVNGPTVLIDCFRGVLILALSALSYRFVELPIRQGRRWRRAPEAELPRRALIASVWSAGALVAIVGLLVASSSWARPSVHTAKGPSVASVAASVSHSVSVSVSHPTSAPQPASVPSASTSASTQPAPVAPPPPPAGPPQLSAFGDSVLLGAATPLRAGTSRLDLDAVEGRQANNILSDVSADAAAHTLAPNVLLHLGNNGIIDADQFASTLAALGDRRRVIVMTLRVPRDWQDPDNNTLTSVSARFPNVVVVDWHSLSADHPDWLYPDGIHLRPAGAIAYSQIVLAACA